MTLIRGAQAVMTGLAGKEARAGNAEIRIRDGRIAAVGRLYDSFLHLVVPAASPVNSLGQLEGRTVSLGTVGSGTEFTAGRLLLARDVRPRDVRLTQADSAVALGAGHIDAFFTLSGIPTPAITTLGQHTQVRLVPLPAEANALASAYPGMYEPATIPATTYEGVQLGQLFRVEGFVYVLVALARSEGEAIAILEPKQ